METWLPAPDGAPPAPWPPRRLWLLDRDAHVLASTPADLPLDPCRACFWSPDRLVTANWTEVSLWGVADGTLERLASQHVPEAWSVVPSATGATIAVRAGSFRDRIARIWYLDPVTLAPVAHTDEHFSPSDVSLWRSPLAGGPLVFGRPGEVRIVTAAAEAATVAGRPPASWVPADLAAVASVAGQPAPTPAAAELLSLLHDWLRHRLGPGAR